MIPSPFQYHAPANVREVLTLLKKHNGEAKVIAGGQSLIPMMKQRLAQPTHVVDLVNIEKLSFIEDQENELSIGPMTTYYELESSNLVRQKVPILAKTAAKVADLQVRNKGTIGGSIAHADPAADIPAALLALDARIKTRDANKARSLKANHFFLDIFTSALSDLELITEILVPIPPHCSGWSYQKMANKASHYAIVGVAAMVTLNKNRQCSSIRVGITGAGPSPVRASITEKYLKGKFPTPLTLRRAAERSSQGIDCLEDLHASSEFREHLVKILTFRALEEAINCATLR